MKEIKAYVHRTRIADVIEAVKATSAWATRPGDAGQHNLTVYAVQGSLVPIDQDGLDLCRRHRVRGGDPVRTRHWSDRRRWQAVGPAHALPTCGSLRASGDLFDVSQPSHLEKE